MLDKPALVAWTVDLVTTSIGDLNVNADVDFAAPAGGAALEVEKLTLSAPVGSGITLTIANAEIVVNPQD